MLVKAIKSVYIYGERVKKSYSSVESGGRKLHQEKIQKGMLFGPESPKELMEDIVFPIRIKEENAIIDMQRL